MHMEMCTGEDMTTTTFADFARGFWDNSARASKPRPTAPKPTVSGDSEARRRQLCGQMAGIIQDLLNLPTLSDADRRCLSISSAVAFLLAGR
jgi:hypothetical protein